MVVFMFTSTSKLNIVAMVTQTIAPDPFQCVCFAFDTRLNFYQCAKIDLDATFERALSRCDLFTKVSTQVGDLPECKILASFNCGMTFSP